MSDIVKAQVVFESVTGLPRDRIIHDWHFVVDNTSDASLTAVGIDLEAFYNTEQSFNAPGEYLSAAISRAVDSHIRFYLEPDNGGAPPLLDYDFILIAAGNPTDFPDQVACCLSYRNESVTSIPERNRRGRVFFGPLNAAAAVDTGDVSVPDSDFIQDLLEAAQALFDENDAGQVWVVYSPTLEQSFPVEAGWIDLRWDTQRRRLRRATSRTTVVF